MLYDEVEVIVMKQSFSTGDIAKLCNVSVRTVQYYDKEGILSPSELSQGGRRIYTEDDLKKFRCICLYKALGFKLEEIKKVTEAKNTYSLLSETILRQQIKIDEEIHSLQHTKERLTAILNQIEETGKAKVESIEEMDALLVKKNRHRKTDVMTYIFLGCYVLLLFAGFPIAVSIGGFTPVVMSVIAVILLLGLIYYHSQVNAYVCSDCYEKFSISFLADMFSWNGGKKGKYLKCPHCGHKGWYRETFPQ
jgi:DNA-binding transcriptional MerR regulator/DNA-directed RNA polymerase subunit RPC12/RpoP